MTKDERLTRTLIQRGESDNYICERLQSLGHKSDEAQQIIHEIRLAQHSSGAYISNRYDLILILLACSALALLVLWFILNGMLS